MKNQFEFSHISTGCLLRTLVRNLWMIVAAALIFSMSVSIYAGWIYVPAYRASVTYAVTARQTSYGNTGNQSAAREVSAVLEQLVGSGMIAESIQDYDPVLAGFDGQIVASRVGESNLLTVTSTADTPEKAFLSLMALRQQLPELVDYFSSDCIIQVIRNPQVSATPVNPLNVRATQKTAAQVGAAAMAVLLCWLSISRETIQTRSGARHLLDMKIVATISRVRPRLSLKALLSRKGRQLQVFSPTASFAYTEQINTICTQLEHEAAEGRKLFMITGVGENEGKSTVTGNVAAALAMMGKKVVVLDCDLRNPSLNAFFDGKYNGTVPLNRLLAEPFTKDSFLGCMVRHNALGMYMLFPLEPDRRCTELLTGENMKFLLKQLRAFDYVILDTPPMGYFADAEALAELVDATLLVVRQDQTPACDINDAADVLRRAKSSFLGCILNDMTASLTEGHHYGYGYGYGYGQYGSYGSRKSGRKSS